MLTLTKKTGYGLIAMSCLAELEPGQLLSARQVAERTQMPVSLVRNVLKTLSAAGYVESVRGSRGGYRLAKAPEAVTLCALIDDIEGPVSLAECVRGRRGRRQAENCRLADCCPIAEPVRHVHERFRQFLEGITLAEIMHSAGLCEASANV